MIGYSAIIGYSASRPSGLPQITCPEPQKGLDTGLEDQSWIIKSTNRHGSLETRRFLDPQPVRHSSPGWVRPLTDFPSQRLPSRRFPSFSSPRQDGNAECRVPFVQAGQEHVVEVEAPDAIAAESPTSGKARI
mgnify:CR=1 FL=1